jgi:hypothetical protein
VVVALLTNLAMNGSDRALMLALPGLAVLAAFALPTLKRSAAAAVDWFSVFFFTTAAIAIWVIYAAMLTGVPAKTAANVVRQLPGFVAPFSALELALGVLATLAWLWLVRWRTGRHQDALWKSLVLPAAGVALCWLLLMTLWLPALDYARSARPYVERLSKHIPPGATVCAPGLGASTVASLEFLGGWRVDARPSLNGTVAADCQIRLALAPARALPAAPAGWVQTETVLRPTDRNEVSLLYRLTLQLSSRHVFGVRGLHRQFAHTHGREGKPEARALAGLALHVDITTVALHRMFHDG